MSIDLSVNLQSDGFGASLQALQSHLQGFLSEYEDKVAQARAQLAHVEALLGSLPAETPKVKVKKKETVAVLRSYWKEKNKKNKNLKINY